MRLKNLSYTAGSGWSTALPGSMDSPQTLVLAFAAPQFVADTAPFAALAAAFPQSLLVGCSTAGEIAGAQVHDASISAAVVHFEHTALRLASTAIPSAADSLAASLELDD